jgi:hypothetical protein
MDAGDRNRTSPFAFTGNRFEFRAVGGGMSIGGPMIALNTACAEAIDHIATKLESAVGEGKALNSAIQSVLTEIIKEHGAVVFNGDGYSAEWHAEAEKRGLLNLKTTPEALKILELPETAKLFDKYKVLSPRELIAATRSCEQYVKTIQVESKLTVKMATTSILPAAVKYHAELLMSPVLSELKVTGKVAKLAVELEKTIEALEVVTAYDGAHGAPAEAAYMCTKVVPAMLKVREVADTLEGLVADEIWPLPTYQECCSSAENGGGSVRGTRARSAPGRQSLRSACSSMGAKRSARGTASIRSGRSARLCCRPSALKDRFTQERHQIRRPAAVPGGRSIDAFSWRSKSITTSSSGRANDQVVTQRRRDEPPRAGGQVGAPARRAATDRLPQRARGSARSACCSLPARCRTVKAGCRAGPAPDSCERPPDRIRSAGERR